MASQMPSDAPSYAHHRMSQAFDPNLPPAPPPKPNSQEVSRQSTPASGHPFAAPPLGIQNAASASDEQYQRHTAQTEQSQDPGDRWLPRILEDTSKQDLEAILNNPKLLAALTNSRSTAHPSTAASREPLQAALAENISLASHLIELEGRLEHLRSSTQTQLLAAHNLERQWRQKQSDMDRALSPFSPSSLYQRLSQGVQEQEMVCKALEESFLEGDGGLASEREVTDWVKRYRDAKKLLHVRSEQKERWDEGRVGGWR